MSEELPPARPKKNKQEALWMMSFSDMSLVLLCFFVLMISTMKPDKEKLENIKDGMTAKVNVEKKDSLRTLSEKIKEVIRKKKLEKAAQVTFDADGLHIEFKDGLLFRSGSSKTNPKFRKVTGQVLSVISKMAPKYKMKIAGHTDDTPLRKNSKFKSNWELSAARGFALMRNFKKRGIKEENISVIAHAHTRPKVPYKNLKGKKLKKARAANRRVVISIE